MQNEGGQRLRCIIDDIKKPAAPFGIKQHKVFRPFPESPPPGKSLSISCVKWRLVCHDFLFSAEINFFSTFSNPLAA